MAKGYPDFFGFSTFPWYGTTQRDYYDSPILATGAEYVINAITGRGVCLGGTAEIIAGNGMTNNLWCRLYIDGALVFDENVSTMHYYNFARNLDSLVYLLYFAQGREFARTSISTNLTYMSSFEFRIYNNTGGGMLVDSSLYYTIIL